MRFMILEIPSGITIIDTKPRPGNPEVARSIATVVDYRASQALRNLLENNAEEYDALVKTYREENSPDF